MHSTASQVTSKHRAVVTTPESELVTTLHDTAPEAQPAVGKTPTARPLAVSTENAVGVEAVYESLTDPGCTVEPVSQAFIDETRKLNGWANGYYDDDAPGVTAPSHSDDSDTDHGATSRYRVRVRPERITSPCERAVVQTIRLITSGRTKQQVPDDLWRNAVKETTPPRIAAKVSNPRTRPWKHSFEEAVFDGQQYLPPVESVTDISVHHLPKTEVNDPRGVVLRYRTADDDVVERPVVVETGGDPIVISTEVSFGDTELPTVPSSAVAAFCEGEVCSETSREIEAVSELVRDATLGTRTQQYLSEVA